MAFSDKLARLDRRLFSKLAEGDAIIDGKPIPATFDKESFLFAESRGTERVLTISQSIADSLGIKPHTNSQIVWQGASFTLSSPPIYQGGLIKLVLV